MQGRLAHQARNVALLLLPALEQGRIDRDTKADTHTHVIEQLHLSNFLCHSVRPFAIVCSPFSRSSFRLNFNCNQASAFLDAICSSLKPQLTQHTVNHASGSNE